MQSHAPVRPLVTFLLAAARPVRAAVRRFERALCTPFPVSILVTAVLMLPFSLPLPARAQNAAQLEYERQQREARRQQEQQQQEQQRQQQLMNENARRQQEESRRINAPSGQDAGGAYQGAPGGAAPRAGGRRQAAPVDVAPGIPSADWVQEGSGLKGEVDFYSARSTIRRAGDRVQMWEMVDHKAAQRFEGKRFYSMRTLYEYDCRGSRRRMLAASAYQGHVGKGELVGSESFTPPSAWESVGAASGYAVPFLKIACAGK